MNISKYESIKNSLSSEAMTIVELYKQGKIKNKKISLTDELEFADDQSKKIEKTYDKAFDELKENNIIATWAKKRNGKLVEYIFDC